MPEIWNLNDWGNLYAIFVHFCVCVVLGIEFQTLSMLSTYSTTGPYSQPFKRHLEI